MGGAYGHLMHLYEDWDLTFSDIDNVFVDAGKGTLRGATEKTDGMNLIFTYDVASGRLRVARSAGDIKKGGLDVAALAERFPNRSGDIVSAFTRAFCVLETAMHAVPHEDRRVIFGPEGNVWYSAEVISPSCPNVIVYDEECVVLHAHGRIDLVQGKVEHHVDTPGIEILRRHAGAMTRTASGVIHMPQPMVIKAPASAVNEARRCLRETMFVTGMTPENTLRNYVSTAIGRLGWTERFSDVVSTAIIARATNAPGAPNLTQIKKMVGSRHVTDAERWAKQAVQMAHDGMGSIEGIIHGFSVDMLENVRSSMVTAHEDELQRIRNDVVKAINGPYWRACERHARKLGALSNISSSAEGIVFRLGDKAYKLTGSFAPVNQILGIARYGRA